jgi:hypothetical protein
MADGTNRDSLEGYILPKEISENILRIILEKENRCVRTDKTGIVEEE